jgi:hypothetical protein
MVRAATGNSPSGIPVRPQSAAVPFKHGRGGRRGLGGNLDAAAIHDPPIGTTLATAAAARHRRRPLAELARAGRCLCALGETEKRPPRCPVRYGHGGHDAPGRVLPKCPRSPHPVGRAANHLLTSDAPWGQSTECRAAAGHVAATQDWPRPKKPGEPFVSRPRPLAPAAAHGLRTAKFRPFLGSKQTVLRRVSALDGRQPSRELRCLSPSCGCWPNSWKARSSREHNGLRSEHGKRVSKTRPGTYGQQGSSRRDDPGGEPQGRRKRDAALPKRTSNNPNAQRRTQRERRASRGLSSCGRPSHPRLTDANPRQPTPTAGAAISAWFAHSQVSPTEMFGAQTNHRCADLVGGQISSTRRLR